jgi:hypothetical protein
VNKLKTIIVTIVAGVKTIAMYMKEIREANYAELIRGGVLDPYNHPSKETKL